MGIRPRLDGALSSDVMPQEYRIPIISYKEYPLFYPQKKKRLVLSMD